MRPRLLDLFCGAGGAAMGYRAAGFYVVGVDIAPQPRYAGDEFFQGDALEVLRLLVEQNDRDETVGVVPLELMRPGESGGGLGELVGVEEHGSLNTDHVRHGGPPSLGASPSSIAGFFVSRGFVAIHASPPCQASSALRVMPNARKYVDLIAPTRELLRKVGLPYVIENVVGAKLEQPFTLCGAAFGLGTATHDLARHRRFETSFSVMTPPCAHRSRRVIGIYGDHARTDRRHHAWSQYNAVDSLRFGREAMGIDWMLWPELTQAIPPAYTELIGAQLLDHLRVRSAA